MKPYIDKNTEKRKLATDDFEKDFFKLLNNSVFGKTMENVRDHVDIKLVSNAHRLKKLAAKPNCKTFDRINDDLTLVNMGKQKVCSTSPSMSVLAFWRCPRHSCMIFTTTTFCVDTDMSMQLVVHRYSTASAIMFRQTMSTQICTRTFEPFTTRPITRPITKTVFKAKREGTRKIQG